MRGRHEAREPTEEAAAPDWVPTRAMRRAIGFACLLLVAALALGRVDLVLMAVPFALGTALALRSRPAAVPTPSVALATADTTEGGEVAATISVGNPDPIDYDVAVVRTFLPPELRVDNGDRPYAAPLPSGSVVDVELTGTAVRWGRHPIGPIVARAVAADGLLESRWEVCDPASIRVYPTVEPFEAAEAMPRAAGLVGTHRSRRPGAGGELAGIRRFAPGDRLRRIDWRTSLRTGEPHVAATLSDRDAELVLLLDVLHDAGDRPSVLDVTVRAAAGIAEHYLHRGDRVSVLELGPRARWLRAGTGRRHYLTVLEWLLDVRVAPGAYEPNERMFGPLLPPNALVVVLTPVLDRRSATILARLARAGRFVVAVDTLPEGARPPAVSSAWADVAHRLWLLERRNTIGQLGEHGVPVVTWSGSGSLDAVLRDVARMGSSPLAVHR